MISLSLAQCSSLGCASWQNQWTEDEEQARADSTLAGSDEEMRTQRKLSLITCDGTSGVLSLLQ